MSLLNCNSVFWKTDYHITAEQTVLKVIDSVIWQEGTSLLHSFVPQAVKLFISGIGEVIPLYALLLMFDNIVLSTFLSLGTDHCGY